MLVYHGTVLQIVQPDTRHSKTHLDFGAGFYATTFPQHLEESIISILASELNISLRKAMDIYYNSALSAQIAEGSYGIDNLDPHYLVEDLLENEPELLND